MCMRQPASVTTKVGEFVDLRLLILRFNHSADNLRMLHRHDAAEAAHSSRLVAILQELRLEHLPAMRVVVCPR